MSKPADYYRADKGRMTAYVPAETRRLLDVGCGAGRFGQDLKAERPELEVWGVEIDEGAAAEARGLLDEVRVGTYPDVIAGLGTTFDCVVFNDVLEHIADPWQALEATHTLMSANGCVVASIPNLRNWRSIIDLVRHGQFPYVESGVHDVDHLRFFTRRSAADAFEQAGWRIDQLEMVNPMGFRRARAFGALLRPVAGDLAAEADFRQIAVVARPA